MTNILRVLHLASFSGNIGDAANHRGFRPWFERIVGNRVEWTDLEIREFYWKKRNFDNEFVRVANEHDLLIVGGGNYFEVWVSDSPTGTSFALSPALLDQIITPIFFNSLGVDLGQGSTPATRMRFASMVDQIVSRGNCLVSVRNDGSMRALQEIKGSTRGVFLLPDAGFFATTEPRNERAGRLAVNLAKDMPAIRFGSTPYPQFCEAIATILKGLLADGIVAEVVLVPHTLDDLGIISDVVARLPDRDRRLCVQVAACLAASGDPTAALDAYRSASVAFSMRFHANVCPLGAQVPTVGLATYPQISLLFEELGIPGSCLDIRSADFIDAADASIRSAMSRPETILRAQASALERVSNQRREFEDELIRWLDLIQLPNRRSIQVQ